ncbi:N-acetylmuramoyl-L-alanine amidase family protein [Peptostreptococcus equinus]|uniref:N-acetylmuramoyl-L-alanine amidase n=1 Tax=Peptostreptococcus equinus TaxID=3003601 RepID=A0ABY7JUA2_9FIRM|nr:N-acetylmuramoyl-L-alanine amidase [Peptostreptococcus sp. CBA3647]WAW15555.1 N-acetylmuramoyl-L-alanine amidase [Peptostreptococcus sp. CBA3647]
MLKKKKRRKLNKKKLFLVIIVFAIILALIFKIFTFAFSLIKPDNNQTKEKVKTAQEIENEEERKINITIDPAKGGKNKGLATKDGGMYEKDINLEIAKLIKNNLEKHSDVNVKLTRAYDDDLSLEDRKKIINENKTDILISVRLNGQSSSDEASGIDTYYNSENVKSEVKKNSNISNVEAKNTNKDLKNSNKQDSDSKADSEYDGDSTKNKDDRKPLSKYLASSVQTTTLSFIDMKDRGVVKNDIDILSYVKMPAIVMHCGFISNKADAEKLENNKHRSDIANGISEGTLLFIDNYRGEIFKDRINYR